MTDTDSSARTGQASTGTTATTSTGAKRAYHRWAKNDTLEDYSLRYAPKSFRRWSPYVVATTALGGIAYLADFAIGGSIAISYGFSSAAVAILIAAVVIFATGIPIAYYSAKYSVDMDLLTRGAGFGYLGSTLTSIIYASFTFIFFALEGSIMAQAFQLGLHIPLAVSYLIASLLVIPLVIYGMTALSKMQVWTQPIWLIMMVAPFLAIAVKDPGEFARFTHFGGDSPTGAGFSFLSAGAGAGVALSLIAQIGEQVDYLRFMPDKTEENKKQWWGAVLSAGPGWVVLGALKQLGGAFLAFYVTEKIGKSVADEPIQQYLLGLKTFAAPVALGLATFFVVLSQVKINSTNAYSGSLSWSNFFSRVLHKHPGRVVWIFLNVGISLALMEGGVFGFLNNVLGFYSNVAIAWIGAVTADLVINKPLKLSPSYIEFKRAHLYNFNPVGFGSMLIASAVSIVAYFNAFGAYAKAFSPLIALGIGLALSPILAYTTKGKYYIARVDGLDEPLVVDGLLSSVELTCTVCTDAFERPDMASCPFHSGPICSLCCSLEAACHDACKKTGSGAVDLGMPVTATPV
ncbi:permease for cytosine/purines uracil thiamine allantoin [Catenulispora acidiphila DSM 44928]|uniref:Permease for cytosine/purines uracil thiamine allantoin n=1 Tax=Catenulispora acidiphila (strain DSM 44928 / JCM 14897 / NBRC 102108 / NRRL B-24433 / ID139908) TaxID=479433 RepID=C7PWL0_CATAD|nr:allantoin permease [Catenulispora acidiphila]ACU75290.1 permease for cytosine/purines uracil thiamine allantoin [Catenulispora acidiphila DSM 44928]